MIEIKKEAPATLEEPPTPDTKPINEYKRFGIDDAEESPSSGWREVCFYMRVEPD